MKRLIALILAAVLTAQIGSAAVPSRKAAYVGGTVEAFNGAKDPVEGVVDTSQSKALVFTASDKDYKSTTFSIPYASVIDLEYGQKAGRRVGAAVGTTILLGPLGLVTLLSKKRNHFLTIGYKGTDGADQVAILELGKDIVRTSLTVIETRSGKKVEFQDDEARKSLGGK